MPTPLVVPEKVYHGTDAESAESIRRIGLNFEAWKLAAGGCGVETKGFCVSIDRATAQSWAEQRAKERGGPPGGIVVEATGKDLPLQSGRHGLWTDPNELFISRRDFWKVGPGVFQ
jgi:hypothetical protein